jgi:hypothetical protein
MPEATTRMHISRSPIDCFIVGPIGDTHSPPGTPERDRYDSAIQVVKFVIEPACRAVGLNAVRSDMLPRAGELTDQVFRALRDAPVVIADVTGGNANVMYELGLRHTRDAVTLQVGETGHLRSISPPYGRSRSHALPTLSPLRRGRSKRLFAAPSTDTSTTYRQQGSGLKMAPCEHGPFRPECPGASRGCRR